ncbi:hypothetical protein QUA70_22940 [Microcoleus sp. LAD1_D5]|uniref:hypothetical protein n=1 Tax=unclassified Microcoleus TaxID=2642155 RepID=UPI002FCEA536
MVTHNISANISETAFQLDISPSKKAEKLSNQQHFLADAVRQCVKVYQLEPRDWQQFSQTIHPSFVGDISSEKKEQSKALRRGFRFVLTTVHQCIQILNTKPMVWRQFYGELR